jgi:hypothetical protein
MSVMTSADSIDLNMSASPRLAKDAGRVAVRPQAAELVLCSPCIRCARATEGQTPRTLAEDRAITWNFGRLDECNAQSCSYCKRRMDRRIVSDAPVRGMNNLSDGVT